MPRKPFAVKGFKNVFDPPLKFLLANIIPTIIANKRGSNLIAVVML
jgi:hypothetical protein